MPVLSVPGRRHVCHLYLFGHLRLSGGHLQAGHPELVEVVSAQQGSGSGQGISAQLWVSDHDHLRGEVRVRFSAPPSDVVDQNPHDGCHRLHHHGHNSGHLFGLSPPGIDTELTMIPYDPNT